MNTIFGNFLERTIPNLRNAIINLTIGGNNAEMNLEDFKAVMAPEPTLAPYKVYTALLNQSGGDDPYYANDEGLTIGASYQITGTDEDTVDFTNVGAPNNNLNTWFVATGDTPNSWGATNNGQLYINLGAPVVTALLENTIGNIWFTYNDVGEYLINSNGLFTFGKTVSLNDTVRYFYPGTDSFFNLRVNIDSVDSIALDTIDDDINYVNSFLEERLIEIRVYN